jgi:predicted metal-dependent phosphoesterase TrpH
LSKIKKYDLHAHTDCSPDSIISPSKIVGIARRAGLNGMAITDHFSIKGALIAKRLNRDKHFEVIVGEEIATNYGDVVALYIKKAIKGRDFWDVVDQVKSQGGLIIIPHPFRFMHSFGYPLEKLKGKVDGIEMFNSRYFFSNRTAASKARRLYLAEIGSSDGHMPLDIGKGYTMFEGDLRSAIRKRRTTAEGTTKFGILSRVIVAINKMKDIRLGKKRKMR